MTIANSLISRLEGSNILPTKLNDLKGEWVVLMQFWLMLMLFCNNALCFPDCLGTVIEWEMLSFSI
jgi:hypothetical protein